VNWATQHYLSFISLYLSSLSLIYPFSDLRVTFLYSKTLPSSLESVTLVSYPFFFSTPYTQKGAGPDKWAGAVFIDDDEEYCRAVQVLLTPKTEDLPFQAHAINKCIEECPDIPKEERQCLAAYMAINDIKAYALFDTGSTADMMSPDFAWVSEAVTFLLAKQVPLHLGCVSSQSSIS